MAYTLKEIESGKGLYTTKRTTIGQSMSEPDKFFTCTSDEYFGADIEIVGYATPTEKGYRIEINGEVKYA